MKKMANQETRKKVLIIEDDEVILNMYCEKLEQENFIVHVAHNGKEGYKVAVKQQPDIVITDLVMPKRDGFYLVEKIKDNSKTDHIPLMVLTNLDSERDKERIMMQGVDSYIVKSRTTPTQLVEEIKKMLK